MEQKNRLKCSLCKAIWRIVGVYVGKNLWKSWVLSLECKSEVVIDGASGDDEMACVEWTECEEDQWLKWFCEAGGLT